ncbi:ABC transporter ATP-binding protein [Vagococcus zengguangii]|uniref:ABC transporter ATP-binding protein n=2 Tax=Vagococcus zengguangii TaxID=2571750 RepID=A0A4D7CSW3_9ENTE|nr:ABC transporter ATP-binding protein [Vagococcus zengguangii]QCI85832.1 ABC transporter ATP-binding protein [Vagococcus zengguangii]TLG81773.1 ABC transporter ATP-binding protein [Vagococcus zengguangii]
MARPMHGGGRPAEKIDASFSDTWGKLINYCKQYMPAISVALIAAIGGAILTLIGPNKLSELTDIITEGMMTEVDMPGIKKIAMTLLMIYVASVVLSYLQGFIMTTITQRVSKKMRGDIATKINRLPLKYLDQTSYGDTLSRVTNDVDTISQTLNQGIGSLVAAIAQFLGAIVMMYYTDWRMATVGILSSLLGFVFMITIISKSQGYFAKQQNLLGELNGQIEESYNGHTNIKAYNAQPEFIQNFTQVNDKLRNSAQMAQFLSGLMMPLMNFIGNIGYVAVCVTGASLVIDGKITIGVIVAFMLYIRLFTQPLSNIAQSMTSLQSTGAASYRVFGLLEEAEMTDESDLMQHIDNVKGDVTFEHVSFGYDEDKMIIKDFSANVKSGQKIAIVGPTGAGKSTLVNLLMKFYEVNEGEITIDGYPLSTLSRKAIHDAFCMVLQDTWMFEGTIRENLIYSEEGATEERMREVCKAVGVEHFIKTLSKGYDTVLDDNTSLSAGQKQLVTIARAMLKDSPMLILDEATSSVDTRTEILIQQAMDKLMEGRTSFVIAHRLSTIKDADLILVMKDGQIIEQGNHDELIEQKGFYEELYNSQFTETEMA